MPGFFCLHPISFGGKILFLNYMNPSLPPLSHLPSEKVEELKVITERIVSTGKAEIVILFGSYARGDFKKENEGRRKSDFDLLVVTASNENKKELSTQLTAAFKDISTPVQLVIETISRVNSNLEERQYFFSDIRNEGLVLFDSRKEKLAAPIDLSPARRREIAEEDFENWYGIALDFYQTHQFNSQRNKLKIASFELQQAAEMCYTTIEMVFAHYNPYEHNLSVLRERACQFDSRIIEAFPKDTETEIQLFDQLNFAYIGGRYRTEEEFPVSKEQVQYWAKETEKLLRITKLICQEHIDRLKIIEK